MECSRKWRDVVVELDVLEFIQVKAGQQARELLYIYSPWCQFNLPHTVQLAVRQPCDAVETLHI